MLCGNATYLEYDWTLLTKMLKCHLWPDKEQKKRENHLGVLNFIDSPDRNIRDITYQ